MRLTHPDIRMPSLHDPAEIASPTRFRRERDRWPGIEEAARLARITILDHGGRRRPVIHRGSKHQRARIVSRKTARLQITEGRGLEYQVLRCETDPLCDDYQAHPYRIDLVADGRPQTWYPDLVVLERGRPPRLIEVKSDERGLADPTYAHKLAAMAELARRVGWHFQLLYHHDIFGSPKKPVLVKARRENVRAVHSSRFLSTSREEDRRLDRFLATGRTAEWRIASEMLAPGDGMRGTELIERATALGRLSFDFDTPRRPSTPVTVLPPKARSIDIRSIA